MSIRKFALFGAGAAALGAVAYLVCRSPEDQANDRFYARGLWGLITHSTPPNEQWRGGDYEQPDVEAMFEEKFSHLEDGTYDVVLRVVGPNKIPVIKVVRELTGEGIKEAKDLVDSAPATILTEVNLENATIAAKALMEQGAEVDLETRP
jgi:ribosomal protein L7/L12